MSQRSGNRKSSNRRNRKQSPGSQRSGAKKQTTQATTPSTTPAAKTRETRQQPSRRTSRKDVARAEAKKKQQMQLLIGAVAAALVIAVILFLVNRPTAGGDNIDYTGLSTEQAQIITTQGTPASAPVPTDLSWATGSTVGDPNAPVTMHIFSDFQCHFCKQFHDDTLPQIIDDFVRDGQVKLVFHDFPRLGSNPTIAGNNQPNFVPELADPNNESSLASQAAMCAGEQDQYLQMSDKIFANYRGVQEGAFDRGNLDRFASDLDLNTDDFKACMDSGRYVPALADSVTQGQSQGITATPMFILDNGSGELNVVQQTAEGYDLMKKVIENSVKNAP